MAFGAVGEDVEPAVRALAHVADALVQVLQQPMFADHLAAIELEAFDDLPALVYTRGFVQQLAKFLKLDPTQVTKTYLRRLREWRAEADGEAPH